VTAKIDRLFGSKTRVSLLAKLLANPEQHYYLRELSRTLSIPYSMLYKEEKNLLALGIVEEEKKGKITLVTVNKHLPYLQELKSLILKTAGIGELLKEALSLSGVQYALVYGSIASGEETPESDVDLLVIGETNEDKVLSAISPVEDKIGREINYILWSHGEFMERIKSKHQLLEDISEKPVLMLVGDEDEFRRTVKRPNNQQGKAK
jgi:predicted nucleotidyltransferase